jgi:hypothetical protein
MAERTVLGPAFLGASIPDPARDSRYFGTGDTVAIRDAVIALVSVVLPRTKLVFWRSPGYHAAGEMGCGPVWQLRKSPDVPIQILP